MWYQFIKESGRKDIEQIFGSDAYDCVKDLPPKFQPPAAYFSFKGVDCDQIVLTFSNVARIIEKSPKHTISYSKNGVTFNGKTYTIDSWLDFNEEVDAIVAAVAPPKKEELNHFDGELPIHPGKINVVKIHNVNEAISYGIGMRWCISQPMNTMWQSYRDTKTSTFYFVFDGTKADDDPLRRVAVDATARGIELTDVNNLTGTIAEFGTDSNAYLQYLSNQGVDISQFQNDPWTEDEIKERQWIQTEIKDLDRFKNLKNSRIPNVFSRYIGRGHKLQPEQFNWLHDIGAKTLITQYAESAHYIMPEQQQLLDNQQKRTYIRARNILYSRLTEYHPLQNAPDFAEKNKAKNQILGDSVDQFSPETINQIRQDPMNFIPVIIKNPIVLKALIDNGVVNSEYFSKNSKYVIDNIKKIEIDNIPYFVENKILTINDIKENLCHFSRTPDGSLKLKEYGILNDEYSKSILLECMFKRRFSFDEIEKLIESSIVGVEDLIPYKENILEYCLDHVYYIKNAIAYGILNKDDLIKYKNEIAFEVARLCYYIPELINTGTLSLEDLAPYKQKIIDNIKLDDKIPELINLGVISMEDFNENKERIIDKFFNNSYLNYYTLFRMIETGLINVHDIHPYKDVILEDENSSIYPYLKRFIELGILTPIDIQPYIGSILEEINPWNDPYAEWLNIGAINKQSIAPYKDEIIQKHKDYVGIIVNLLTLGLIDKRDIPEEIKNILLSKITHGFQIKELIDSGLFTKDELQPYIDKVVNSYLPKTGYDQDPIASLYIDKVIDDSYVDRIKDRLNVETMSRINFYRHYYRPQPAQSEPQQSEQPEPKPNLAEASFNLRKYMLRCS